VFSFVGRMFILFVLVSCIHEFIRNGFGLVIDIFYRNDNVIRKHACISCSIFIASCGIPGSPKGAFLGNRFGHVYPIRSIGGWWSLDHWFKYCEDGDRMRTNPSRDTVNIFLDRFGSTKESKGFPNCIKRVYNVRKICAY
jgi:hypothetical protein